MFSQKVHRAERRAAPTLSRLLAVRLALTAIVVAIALIGFFFAKYMLDVPALRRATLEAEVSAIVGALRQDRNPGPRPEFVAYPANYAFRIFAEHPHGTLEVLQEVNRAVLPPLPSSESGGAASAPNEPSLSEGFFDLERQPGADRWLLTARNDVNNRVLWVQAVMVGDPAWLWRGVIQTELIDHVLLPVGIVVPLMTLAAFLSTRRALRPLTRVAAQANALSSDVSRGRPLRALPANNLPREIQGVVCAINAMLARLERTLQLQKQFTADAAHELRTPLAVLRLQVSELPASPATDQLSHELDALAALVNQLLRLAQAEAAMNARRDPVDLCAICRKVCEDLAPVALGHGQIIEFKAPAGRVALSGHAGLLDAALRNVIENALKASPPASTISVKVMAPAMVFVEDRGPGVPDAHKDAIFDRFWRANYGHGEGAGIGLALVRRIAELHGGSVHVEDRPGGGARFVLQLAGRDD